jgi:hypothetical protein
MKDPEKIDVAGDWAMVAAQLPKDWRSLGEELVPTGFPAYMGTKVSDISQPLRLALYHVAANTSLKTTAAVGAAAGIIDMSSVALHKWMRRLGPYLSTLVARMTDAEMTFAPERWAGYDIVLVDASSVSRPGAEGTTARIHYALRLTSLRPVKIEVTDETGGETFRRFEPDLGELWMGDRGYANPPGIASVKERRADVLVRYNRGSLPLYDIHGQPLDVRQRLLRLKRPGVPRQWFAAVHGPAGAVIQGRLCAVRLPPDKAEEARARLHREQGSAVTQASLDAAEYVVVFTTVPRSRLSAALVMELYSLRWQLELHIKRDKSIAGLDRLPNFRPDTIHSWLCAKLLVTQIARKIATPAVVAIPPCAVDGRAARRQAQAQTEPSAPKQRRRGAVAGHDPALAVHLCRAPAHRAARRAQSAGAVS